jgi:hypothetical protein
MPHGRQHRQIQSGTAPTGAGNILYDQNSFQGTHLKAILAHFLGITMKIIETCPAIAYSIDSTQHHLLPIVCRKQKGRIPL